MELSLMFCMGLLFLPLAKTNQIIPLLQAMEKLVDFYQNDFKNLNVDGLFGLRVLEGHLDLILKKNESLKLAQLDGDIIARVKKMKIKATQTADLAKQHVKKDNFRYYKQLSYVVGSPWDVFEEVRQKVDPAKIWTQDVYQKAKKSVMLDENVSDRCMSELIGSHKVNGSLCDISMTCVKTMTAPGLVGYGNTHQILWTMLAQKAGCTEQLEKKLKKANRGTLLSLRLEMCTNNFYQLKQTLMKMEKNVVIPAFQDLFLEQLFICPSLGYYEFLHPHFLQQIMSWQLPLGCFGKMERAKNPVVLDAAMKGTFSNEYDDDKDYDDFDQLLGRMKLENVVKDGVVLYNKTANNHYKQSTKELDFGEPHNIGRKLLVEKDMTGGCLAHKTAVASGALVMYLRFLCDADAAETFNTSSRQPRSPRPMEYKHIIGNISRAIPELVSPRNSHMGNVQPTKDKNIKPDQVNNTVVGKADKIANKAIQGKVINGQDSTLLNSGPDVKNDMSDLNHHLNQLNAPDLNEHVEKKENLPEPMDHLVEGKDSVIVKPTENNTMEEEEENDVDEDDEYPFDDDDDEIDDDEPDDNDVYDDEDDDLNNTENDYNDVQDNQEKDFETKDGNLGVKPLEKTLLNNYNDENNYDSENNDEYNAGYDDNDEHNVDGIDDLQPHMNLRNVRHPDFRLNDGEFDDKNLNILHDYKYENEDDEEEEDVGDDYQYDDENDELEKRHEEELKGDVQFDNAVKKTQSNSAIQKVILHNKGTLSRSTAFFVFGFCITLVLLLMYKFIRKRRIRIRFNPKYFNV